MWRQIGEFLREPKRCSIGAGGNELNRVLLTPEGDGMNSGVRWPSSVALRAARPARRAGGGSGSSTRHRRGAPSCSYGAAQVRCAGLAGNAQMTHTLSRLYISRRGDTRVTLALSRRPDRATGSQLLSALVRCAWRGGTHQSRQTRNPCPRLRHMPRVSYWAHNCALGVGSPEWCVAVVFGCVYAHVYVSCACACACQCRTIFDEADAAVAGVLLLFEPLRRPVEPV